MVTARPFPTLNTATGLPYKYGDPMYPVIIKDPTMSQMIGFLRPYDYALFASVSASSYGFGYIFGAPVRMPTAATSLTLGATAAGLMMYQNVYARLVGYAENDREAAKAKA